MTEQSTQVVQDYVETVFRRGREPMEPVDFQPNFADQPSRHKTYLGGVARFPLPEGAGVRLRPTADVLFAPPPEEDGQPWTMESLATLLRLSYGQLDRRLRVSWNQDTDARVLYPESLWGRGTASGGGMYPLEIYWVAGPGAPMTPGVYHYSTAHHGFERLLVGDLTEDVRAACDDQLGTGVGPADGFLLVSTRFWKNSFKYNSFCYHVVTQDCGAILGSFEVIARGLGRRLGRVLWFDDERLNDLLGLDTMAESVLAVVPLPFAPRQDEPRAPEAGRGGLIDRPSFERSQVTIEFEQVTQVHRAVLADRRPRPDRAAATGLRPVRPTGLAELALPDPRAGDLGTDLDQALRTRHTSFGSFTGSHPMTLQELSTVLAGASSARNYPSDVAPTGTGFTGLYVLANRVTGLATGSYRYDPDSHCLQVVQERPVSDFLQRNYYLSNYNLDQVGAVLAISARWVSTVEAYGNRGYRVLNAEVGAVAQTAYVAASAAGVGCGAVLGFDNLSIDEAVGLDRSDERTFLFVLLGHERADSAHFDYRLI
ncbi:MAG TPA: SagB family peptide dehydrogenase [Jatrophihabitans sp.]|jgi:SagB-type dehydrogenase family enzyme|uniref:SagB family peptide dehydrogenase n=1 Tax=Jatrophihabitans sp. TaxID=1932789 RepID=UPI002F0EF633